MKAALIHQCERDVLVVRQKGEKSWSKIRSQRPWVRTKTVTLIFILTLR